MRAVLDELGVEKARVLGFSMGLVAALRFAIKSPERVEKLVLVSAMASRLPEAIIQRARLVEDMLQQQGLKETYNFYFSGPMFEGARDSHYLDEADLLAEKIPDARKFIVEDAGHPIAVQALGVFQDQVMGFLGHTLSGGG